MKKITQIVTIFFLFVGLIVNAQQCWLASLTSDLNNAEISAGFKQFMKNNPDATDAYRVLHNYDQALKNDVNLLTKLSSDIGGNSDLLSLLNQNSSLFDSWKYVSDLKPSGTSKLTQDIDFLKVVNRQRGNTDLMNKIGSDKYDDLIKNYAGQCKGCDAPASSASTSVKHLPPHDEMLESLEAFANKHHGKDGFDKVINDLKSTDPRKQKGAEFVTNALKGQDGVTAFEFNYLDDLDNTADFVLNGKNIDGKSWSVTGSINNIGNWNLPKQLKDYLKSDEVFELWFDYSRFQKSANGTYSSMSKTDAVEHIKKQYQKLFQKESKAQELFEYMGETRFKEVFGNEIQTVDDFIDDVVSDLSNSDLYGFIKVK